MTKTRRSFWSRAALGGLAAGLFLILSGDRGAYTAAAGGIDPLDILKLQIKPNVLIILDSSGSMMEGSSNLFPLGGDDYSAKMAQAKKALNLVLTQNQGTVNFGLATYFVQNVNKQINSQNYDGRRGTLTYVSDDPNADVWVGGAPDFFRTARSNTVSSYDGTTAAEVYESFIDLDFRVGYTDAATCTVEPCRRVLRSRFLRNNVKFKWDTSVIPPPTPIAATKLVSRTAITCPLPPTQLFQNDPDVNGDGLSDVPRPCFQMEDSGGVVTTFWYSTGNWQTSSGTNCSGAALLNAVAACSADNVPAIKARLKPELPIDGSCGNPVGIPCGINPVDSTTPAPHTAIALTNPAGVNADTQLGIIAAGSTPLAASLNYVRANFTTVFPNNIGGVQQNFVILITDGLDTCAANPTVDPVNAALGLYNNNPRVYTFVIGLALNTGVLDQIARAGSGGARDSIPAANAEDLVAALNSILDIAVSTGAFSASQSVIGTVFELIVDLASTPATTESPYDPATRYNQRVNVLYQSTFGLPGWEGHLYAYYNDGTFVAVPRVNFTGNWDAGETLFEQVSQVLETEQRGSGRQPNQFIFAELHNGASVDGIVNEDPANGGALIKRRIFTSNGNGSFVRDGTNDNQFDSAASTGRNVVALWPPNQAGLSSGIANVDPSVGTVGPLDDALGIGPGSTTVLSFADLQSKFGACLGSADADSGPVPAGCDVVADATLALDTARKEARQILLAWLAGARLDRGTSDAKPRRSQDIPGELLYRDRGWMLLDSTFSTPAVVGPPLAEDPPGKVAEWLLFKNGRRNSVGLGIDELDKGFGLTNPDKDDPNPQGNTTLKPVMTVVYSANNDGLHAFSALTSEELWSFVPYDQLGKIAALVETGQARNPHVYMLGTSLRFANVFVPDVNGFTLPSPSGTPVTFSGRWRRVMLLGRGAGGKFYTALDVTAPGPFTRPVLATNPPWVMWSRGNPDTADPVNYAKMGETWSIPAIGEMSGASTDWRIFTGSGYGDTPEEGTTFYELNPVNGDVIIAKDISDGDGSYIPDNALVAPPAGFNTFALDLPSQLVRSTPNAVTRVYIPDLHGRIWKFGTTSGALFADVGPTQPFANGPALLKLGGIPHVFLESGNDSRITADPSRPFKMYGFKDNGGDVPLDGDGLQYFAIDFPASAPSGIQFRGTVRPASGYTADGMGIVYFAGTRFNPAGADCLSSFDTIIFGVVPEPTQALGYSAGYDFNGDGVLEVSQIIEGQKAQGISNIGGSLTVSLGGTLSSPPPPGGGAGVSFPGPSPTPPPGPPAPPIVLPTKLTPGSPVCRQ